VSRAGAAALLGAALALSACSQTDAVFSHEPIPLALAGNPGGLVGLGTAASRDQTFPMLVDSASPLTAFSDGSNAVRATRGTLRLYGADPDVGEVPRLELPDVQLLVTPLGGTGLDVSSPVSGVLGGDNLRRFVVGLSYQPPAIQLTDQLVLDDCDVSERCGTVLPFSLAGGHQAIDIGENVYSYPASYVLLDACLEPAIDPLEPGLVCTDRGCLADCPTELGTAQNKCFDSCRQRRMDCGGSCHDCDDVCGSLSSAECLQCVADAERYLPHGIGVRLAVATGFPGLALTAAAYDRLRGRGSAAALLGASAHQLFTPDQPLSSAGIGVALDQLGIPASGDHDPAGRAALALVGRNGYFGACEELARSRRLRLPPELQAASCLRSPARDPNDTLYAACIAQDSSGYCDDRNDNAHTAPYVELAGPLPIIIVPDTFSLLQDINADARPDTATVEGVIGTELLRRLQTTVDYPGGRLIATCADTSCKGFPQWGHGTDCQYPLSAIPTPVPFGGRAARTFIGGGCALP
jgi:hypothetical protein